MPRVRSSLTARDLTALGLVGLYALRRHREDMDVATRVVVAATTITALCFSSPLVRPDVLERLAMMAYVPGRLLRAETVTTLAEGEYFRLGRVEPAHDPPAAPRAP